MDFGVSFSKKCSNHIKRIQVELDALTSKIISQKDKVNEQDLLLKQEIESEINCFMQQRLKEVLFNQELNG